MTWISKLYQTYEQALNLDTPDKDELLPISHTRRNAHINITIDSMGNFKRANVLDTRITLPATEDSANRTSGGAPHPLADTLEYVAKDFCDYMPEENNKKKNKKEEKYQKYQQQLKKWCASEYNHPKAQAVLHYIEKGCVVEDLIKHGILSIDDNNTLVTNWNKNEGEKPKIFEILPKNSGKYDQGKALVYWTVETEGEPDSKTWTDKSLQQRWIDFEASQNVKEGFCFVSHKKTRVTDLHPKGLRYPGDGAKLISSNDESGFTYRGRFNKKNKEKNEACELSYEVSQKAHIALRWLIKRQAYRDDSQVIIAWAVSNNPVPSPMESAYDIPDEEIKEIMASEETSNINHGRTLGHTFAKAFKKKLAGYSSKLAVHESIVLMVLDSASSGRMAIRYYREIHKDDYFKRLEAWYQDTQWPQRKSKNVLINTSPPPWMIVNTAYGKEASPTLKKNTEARLLRCIVDQQQIPRDLLEACLRRASNPASYKKDDKWLWRRDLSVACSLYKGYRARYHDKNKRRHYKMSLERDYKNRDYLYGRLLALAEKIERKSLDNVGEKRATNAERLMSRFAHQPYTTWPIIFESLRPYKIRLEKSNDAGLLFYWENEIANIKNLFESNSFKNNAPLSGEYLLGYYCQKYDRKKDDAVDPLKNDVNDKETTQ